MSMHQLLFKRWQEQLLLRGYHEKALNLNNAEFDSLAGEIFSGPSAYDAFWVSGPRTSVLIHRVSGLAPLFAPQPSQSVPQTPALPISNPAVPSGRMFQISTSTNTWAPNPWISDAVLQHIKYWSAEKQNSSKCECGAHAIGHTAGHSSWCPLASGEGTV